MFFVWLDERSKKRARQKSNNKFQYFDKYYTELETESEKQLEKRRQERLEVLACIEEEKNNESENIDIAQFSGKAAV